MRKYRLWTWTFVAMGLWSLGFIYNVYLSGFPSSLRHNYKIKAALASKIEQPKIIIAGGSGVHYTINSHVMERNLGIPVINFGTNGGIGLNVLLPSIIDHVNSGDIVLLILEYPLILNKDGFDDLSATFGITINRPGLGGVNTKDIVETTLTLGTPSLQALIKTAQDLLQEGRIDYFGDPLTNRGDATIELTRVSSWWKMPIRSSISQHSIETLQQFKKDVEAKGASLMFSLPVIYASDDDETLANIQKTADVLSEIAPIVYNRETLNIKDDSNLFADTHYHLKIPARITRSEELAAQLKMKIPQVLSISQENSPKLR